jgi:uncharacterized 2Fe-2S/4Fe-4S cluster protein (DUF4445 family)
MSTLSLKRYVEIPAGSLDNNKADIDRLNHAVTEATDAPYIEWSLDLVLETASIMRESSGKVTVTGSLLRDTLVVSNIEPGDTSQRNFGIAVDIGTTVVAVELIDLITGKTLATFGEVNGQAEYGEDLLTRLHFAGQGGSETLTEVLRDTINDLIKHACSSADISPSEVMAVAIAGNTSMAHFFLGLNPAVMRFEPYIPSINHIPRLRAKDVSLITAPNATVYVFPSVGGYFGGDLISGAIASGIAENEGISLLLDIGTNVEAILGNKEWLVAIAGSAGPALEAGVAECARRAEPGAIERVTIDPATFEPSYSAIAGEPVYGFCGSGLIDLVAQLYLSGLLDSTGRFALENKTERWQEINGRTAYVLVEGANGQTPTYITEKDIHNLLTTKAAMIAATTILINSVGIALEDIEHIYTAGSFGIHIDVDSATTIGLYPKLPKERFVTLGNGSLAGARAILLNAERIVEAEHIADTITYLELNVHPEFMDIFRSASYI